MTRILIISLFLPIIMFGQVTSTKQGGKTNIYNDAIEQYLSRLNNVDRIKVDTLFVEGNEVITDSLLKVINGIQVKPLNWSEINGKLDQQSSMILYKLFPLQFDKGQFSV